MAFAVKYRLEFTEVKGTPLRQTSYTPIGWKIEIEEDAFGGSVTELTGDEDPLEISWKEFDLYSKTVIGSKARIRLKIDSTNQLSDLTLADDEDTHKVKIYWDLGSGYVLFWQGFIIPGNYEEDYRKDRAISMVLDASDKLDTLYDIEYSGAIIGDTTLINLIYNECLVKTGLTDLDIYENINVYDTFLMNSTAADSPLVQAEVHKGTFEGRTCGEILENVLALFGAYIIQRDGVWQINHIPLNDGTSYTNRRFNSTPAYQSNTSENFYLDANAAGQNQVRWMTRLAFSRPYKRTVYIPNLGKVRNQIIDGRCDNSAFSQFSFTPDPVGYEPNRWKVTAGTLDINLRGSLIACLEIDCATSAYAYSAWCNVSDKQCDFEWRYMLEFTGAGTDPTIEFLLEWQSREDPTDRQYYVAAGWSNVSTSPMTVTINEDESGVWNENLRANITPPAEGFIRIRIYGANGNGHTINGQYVDKILMYQDDGFSTAEEEYEIGVSADTIAASRKAIERDVFIADKGSYMNISRWSQGTYANFAFEVDFGNVLDGETVSFNILGTTRTFEYQTTPTISNDEFNNAASLVSLIQDYTGDHYAVWTTVEGLQLDAIRIRAVFYEGETGGDYDWGTPTYDTNIAAVTDTNDSSPSAMSSTAITRYGALHVNGEKTGSWDNGEFNGTLLQLAAKFLHNNYGAVSQRHRGEIKEFAHAFSPINTLEDTENNSGKVFLFTGGRLNCKSGRINGQWQQVITTEQAVTIEENYIT